MKVKENKIHFQFAQMTHRENIIFDFIQEKNLEVIIVLLNDWQILTKKIKRCDILFWMKIESHEPQLFIRVCNKQRYILNR